MTLSPKRQRLIFVVLSFAFMCVAVLVILQVFRSNIVFFYTPSEVREQGIAPGQTFRLGGLVETGSIKREEKEEVSFTVTDNGQKLRVRYSGVLPSLFREGQGVVAEGELTADGSFAATRVLAKHDENYMPPEVADKIKKTGHWRGEEEEVR